MLKNIIIGVLVLITNSIFSQEEEWLTYNLDSIISIELPGEVYELDTISQGMKMYQIYSHLENSSFIVQKTLFEDENKNEDLSKLPYDLKSLKEQYNGLIEGMASIIPDKLVTKEIIEKESFIGYHLQFRDSVNRPTYEGQIYLLNKHLYTFYYVNFEGINDNKKELFFNAIRINTDQKISQYLGKPQAHRIGYLFGKYFFYILIFGGIIFFLVKRKKV